MTACLLSLLWLALSMWSESHLYHFKEHILKPFSVCSQYTLSLHYIPLFQSYCSRSLWLAFKLWSRSKLPYVERRDFSHAAAERFGSPPCSVSATRAIRFRWSKLEDKTVGIIGYQPSAWPSSWSKHLAGEICALRRCSAMSSKSSGSIWHFTWHPRAGEGRECRVWNSASYNDISVLRNMSQSINQWLFRCEADFEFYYMIRRPWINFIMNPIT